MSSVSGLCFNQVQVNGLVPVMPPPQVPGIALNNVLCKLPVEVARKAVSSFLDLADIVRFDSAALVHKYRKSFQHMYQGSIVVNTAVLNMDLPAAEWLFSRSVYVQNMRIGLTMLEEWPIGFAFMRTARMVVIEPKISLDSSLLSAPLSNCRQLTSIGLQGFTLDAKFLQAVMSSCPQLRAVDVGYTNVDSVIIAPLLSPRILSLDLTYCFDINDTTIIAVTRSCTNLQSLNLNNCWYCTRASLNAIARNCPQLQELYLQEWEDLPDESMAALAAGCRDLRKLRLICSSSLTSAGIRAIAACCTKLVEVTLFRCRNVDASAVIALVSSCPELRKVQIQADDAVVMALSHHCPHLTDVSLSTIWNDAVQGYCSFKGESLAAFLRNCQQLRRLWVPDYSSLPPGDGITCSVEVLSMHVGGQIGDEAVGSMIQYTPKLRQLHLLGGSCSLTDAVVLTVAAHCPLLKEVDLTDISQLTDPSIIALAQRCPLLRKINLSDCWKLTDAAVIAIAQHCPQLTHLNLQDRQIYQHQPVIPITGSTVKDIPGNSNAAVLKEWYPETFISDASIAALAAHSHRLRELNVHGHTLISEAALTALTVALPRCVVNMKLV